MQVRLCLVSADSSLQLAHFCKQCISRHESSQRQACQLHALPGKAVRAAWVGRHCPRRPQPSMSNNKVRATCAARAPASRSCGHAAPLQRPPTPLACPSTVLLHLWLAPPLSSYTSGLRKMPCTNTRFMSCPPCFLFLSATQWYSHSSTSNPASAASTARPSGVKK